MIEQEIESKLVDLIKSELDAVDMVDVQYVSAWSPALGDAIKGQEDKHSNMVVVKAYPRSYDTPTIPTATLRIDINVLSMVDACANGSDYLKASSAIMSMLQRWQTMIACTNDAFKFDDFNPAGFRIASGDCGLDKSTGVWNCTYTIEIYGAVLND